MPGISASHIPIPFSGGGGTDWSTYWSTRTPSGLTAAPVSDSQIDLSFTENGADFDGYSWERSEDGGATYTEFETTLITDVDTSDTTFTEPMILMYRVRAYVGTQYSPYTDVVTVYPAGVRINSDNSHVTLADAANELYFSNGAGTDYPFSVIAIAKCNSINAVQRILVRGDANGNSYTVDLNNGVNRSQLALFATDSQVNDLIYKGSEVWMDTNIHRMIWTYSGSKTWGGIKIYKDGVVSSSYNGTLGGTYPDMNDRAGIHVGRDIKNNYTVNADLYTLIICDKELSQAEVTEFQNMATEAGISSLSFYADILTINLFAGNLEDDLNAHDGSSVAPCFFFEHMILPSAIETTFQDQFEDFKLGWFIHWNMETYNGDETNARTVVTSAPAVFTAPANVPVSDWAALAAESGKIDYAILTVSHMYGFSLYNYQTALWEGSQIDVGGGIIVPTYTKYDVGETSADKNIVTKFITEFNAVGIKPMFYFCVGWARNWCGQKWVKDQYTDENYQFTEYHRYVRARLMELARLNPFGIWIDVDIYYAPTYQQDLYDAIKLANPDVGVIINCYDNKDRIDNSFGSMDGASIEEISKPALPNDDWWVQEQVISGVTYPCKKEYCFTSTESNKWFWHADNVLRTIEELQAEYDYGKAAGVPCVISVSPDQDGVIDEAQADLIASLVL